VDREQCVPRVVAAAHHVAQLEPLELAGDLGGFGVELARQRVVALRVRQFREAADAGKIDEATAAMRVAYVKLDKATSKGVIHKNQAANRKSAIAKRAEQLKQG